MGPRRTGPQSSRTLFNWLAAPALAVTLCLSTSTASAAPASSGQPTKDAIGGSPTVDAFIDQMGRKNLDNQDALMQYRDWISALPDQARAGFIATVDDVPRKSATLLWNGLPTRNQELIIAEAKRRGIKTLVQQRDHSLADLNAAAQTILDSAGQPQWQGFNVSSVTTLSADFDGVVVNGSYNPDAITPSTRTSAAPDGGTTTYAESIISVPVKIDAQMPAAPAATRSNDYAPFNAGGYMLDGSGTTCSTGFSVLQGGQAFTMTARHCTSQSYHARDGSARYGSSYVTTSTGAGGRLMSTSGSALMFDGAWNDSAGYVKHVMGLRRVGIGDQVCTSGGNSGVHCYVRVDGYRSFNDGFGTLANLVHGTQVGTDPIAVIQGDSGGPVLWPINGTEVYAVGMIQAVDQYVGYCGPAHDLGGNICGTGVIFTPQDIYQNSGLTLKTY